MAIKGFKSVARQTRRKTEYNDVHKFGNQYEWQECEWWVLAACNV